MTSGGQSGKSSNHDELNRCTTHLGMTVGLYRTRHTILHHSDVELVSEAPIAIADIPRTAGPNGVTFATTVTPQAS